MTDRFVLLNDGYMGLTVQVFAGSISAFVKKEFGLTEVFLISCHQVQFCQGHFGYLVAWHGNHLSGTLSYLSADTICITYGNIQECPFSGSLVMSNGSFHHVSQVVEFMAQFLHFFPSFTPGPFVGMLGIHGTGRIQVSVGFLCSSHQYQDTVNIGFQLLIGIGLKQITGSFNGLVDVGVIKGIACNIIFQAGVGSLDEVIITPGFLTLAESKRNSDLTAGFQALSPESIGY